MWMVRRSVCEKRIRALIEEPSPGLGSQEDSPVVVGEEGPGREGLAEGAAGGRAREAARTPEAGSPTGWVGDKRWLLRAPGGGGGG